MFINLNHQNLDIYKLSKELVYECYQFTKLLPLEERFGITSQVKRAALSVHLNMAEGFTRQSSAERSRFHEIARGSLIEIDAAIDVAHKLNYFKIEQTEILGKLINRCFSILSKLIVSHR